jgi:hypothetical protein
MKREDIIKLAREAGCKPFRSPDHWDDVQVFSTPDVLERFAALVAHAANTSQERVDEIVKQEHDRAVELAQAYERGWNAALAQQEPVAWMGSHDRTDLYYRKPPQADVIPLYTAPPKKEWVGLTDEEYAELWGKKPDLLNFFRKIEAKLKERNT